MNDLRTAAQAVIDVWFRPHGINYVDLMPYMEALRQALAEPEPSVDALIAELADLKECHKDLLDSDNAQLQKLIAEIDALAEPVEPVAWINVEKRKLEWNTDFPVRWETPTVVKLDKLPLYTTPPSVDALIAEAVAKEREACAEICDAVQKKNEDAGAFVWEAKDSAKAIRARGQK